MTGLVGWWPLGEQSGQANDLSGEGNHGTVNGATQGVWGVGGLTAYSFDGTDDEVSSDGWNITSPLTFSAWVRKTSTATGVVIVDHDGTRINFAYEQSGSNGFEFHIYDGSHNTIESGNTSTDTWLHLVGVTNGSVAEFYINGSSVGTVSHSTIDEVDDRFQIGSSTNDASWFEGQIADVRVYNRALSPQEVQELYEWGSGDYTDPTLTRTQADEVSQIGWDDTGDSGTGFTGLWFSEDGEAVTNTTEIGFQ